MESNHSLKTKETPSKTWRYLVTQSYLIMGNAILLAMSEDSFRIGGFGFHFGISKKDNQIKLNEGETILLRYWSWRKFGHVHKAYSLQDGKVHVQRIN